MQKSIFLHVYLHMYKFNAETFEYAVLPVKRFLGAEEREGLKHLF